MKILVDLTFLDKLVDLTFLDIQNSFISTSRILSEFLFASLSCYLSVISQAVRSSSMFGVQFFFCFLASIDSLYTSLA